MLTALLCGDTDSAVNTYNERTYLCMVTLSARTE